MTYSKFSLAAVKEKFGLSEVRDSFLANIKPMQPSDWLLQTIKMGEVAGRFSEKARSETMVMPVILELQNRTDIKFGVYSGANLETDKKLGLKGECDFVLSIGEQTTELESAIFCMIEAKDNDIEDCLGQCVAQMISARLFNKKVGKENITTIYGCVTTGDEWQFLKLENQIVYKESKRFYFGNLDQLLGAIMFVIDEVLAVNSEVA